MNFLVIASCLFAAASAGYAPVLYAAPWAHHIPAIGHNGVPLDTPEVAHARAQHFHDYAVAAQRNGVAVHHGAPLIHGVHPVDTPEVQLAKSAHFAAHAEALARNGVIAHYRKRRGIYLGHNGVPVDTPEVQLAKSAHFAAHVAAQHGHALPQVYGAHLPLDTPEVAHAKAQHFAAHAERGNLLPLAYNAGYWTPHAVIGHDGHPVETPEVQAAKAHHFAAHAAARGHYY